MALGLVSQALASQIPPRSATRRASAALIWAAAARPWLRARAQPQSRASRSGRARAGQHQISLGPARRLNPVHAALSLGVTESAVRHQVRRLEDFLRTALFDRSGPGVRLTAAGRRYLEQIDPAIRQIQSATAAMLRPTGRNVVRLTLPPSLAATWLIPQLGAFEREHPDIDLQLVPTTRVVDLRRDQVDLAVRHGTGPWPGSRPPSCWPRRRCRSARPAT
jgi:DNA-binding transcriptional LysR family regulator